MDIPTGGEGPLTWAKHRDQWGSLLATVAGQGLTAAFHRGRFCSCSTYLPPYLSSPSYPAPLQFSIIYLTYHVSCFYLSIYLVICHLPTVWSSIYPATDHLLSWLSIIYLIHHLSST